MVLPGLQWPQTPDVGPTESSSLVKILLSAIIICYHAATRSGQKAGNNTGPPRDAKWFLTPFALPQVTLCRTNR